MNLLVAVLGPEKSVGFGWLSHDLHPEGVCGNAGRADAARGQKLLEYLADLLAKLINEVGKTPLDTLKSRV